MNLAIEFHDSKLTSIEKRGDSIELCLEAYIHASEGAPGRDAGEGWLQEAILVVGNGVVEGEITNWPADLYHGTLGIDGEVTENVIPLPLERVGNARITLMPSFYDPPLVVLGNSVRLALSPGVPRVIEDFPGV